MFHVALYQPEIPPNTGNIIRLCANTGSILHLIHPLGFELEDRQLRRAGLDYHDLVTLRQHASLEQFYAAIQGQRLFAVSTHGVTLYTRPEYRPDDVLLFGPESRGLPRGLLKETATGQLIHIPMRSGNRSLNLSNAVAVVLYEAWRQHGFA
ncbi:MAG: tRNA (cytidine(34)-2'-O)-methyltransferase [Chromatiaceae bacterium]|nr:tRNA (cytidine(34)-2'-O)-methyltransferase [Chromatiaceae bacterium]